MTVPVLTNDVLTVSAADVAWMTYDASNPGGVEETPKETETALTSVNFAASAFVGRRCRCVY